MKRILALMLVCVFALSAFCSCATIEPDVNVTLKFVTGDDVVFNQKIAVAPVDGQVTVIQAVNEAIAQFGLTDIVVSDNGYSITKAGIYKEGMIDGMQFYWMYDINGVEPETGKANTNTVAEGDVITYTFYYSVKNEADLKAAGDSFVYTSDLEIFSYEETEAEEEEEAEGEEGEEEAAE